jgi:rhodanese-related sulfurtransferase
MRFPRALIALAILLGSATGASADHGRYFTVLTIDADSLHRLLDAGRRLVLVDLRGEDAYRRGRLPGARSIPLAAVESRRAEIPREGMVVLYCACPVPAVTPLYQRLRREGWRELFVLEEGIDGWTSRGYPLEH